MVTRLLILYYVMAILVAAAHRKKLWQYIETDALFVLITYMFAWPVYLLWFMAEPPEDLKS